MTSIALVFIALSWPAAIAGALIFHFRHAGGPAHGKADPQMTKVYRRHVNYRAFYPRGRVPSAKADDQNNEGGGTCLALKTWRESQRLPDLLDYAAVIDDGIVTTKAARISPPGSMRAAT